MEGLETESIEAELQEKIEAIFSKAQSYQEAEDQLLQAYPDLHLQTLEDALFNYLANSEIQGRVEIEAEDTAQQKPAMDAKNA